MSLFFSLSRNIGGVVEFFFDFVGFVEFIFSYDS